MNNNFSLAFDAQPDKITYLQSGDITCLYEHGKLRYLRYKGVEVIRMIYTAIRDHNWNTAPYEVTGEKIHQHVEGFSVSYLAQYRMNNVSYEASVHIEARQNEVRFHFNGKSLSSFKKNRIGICVLHTIASIIDKQVKITEPSGDTKLAVAGFDINPNQPFKQIQRMQYAFDGGEVLLNFSGDIFETEDQRNWTDSSLKTYNTPQELPMPVEVNVADEVNQEIKITFTDGAVDQESGKRFENPGGGLFPRIGFSRVKGKRLSTNQIELLRQIIFDHYRVELDLSSSDWRQELVQAADEAEMLHTKLQLVAICGDDAETSLRELATHLAGPRDLVESILVIDKTTNRSTGELMVAAYRTLKSKYPFIVVGYGTTNHFADLNRNMPGEEPFDFLSFGITPQAHSTDVISLLENLDTQTHILATLRARAGDVPVHVAPVTFKGRKANLFGEGEMPADYDERQHKQTGAAWILKTMRNFAGTHITFFDVAGYKGIVPDSGDPGDTSPAYHLLRALKQFAPVQFSDERNNNSIELLNKEGDRFVVALDPQFATYRDFVFGS